MARLMGVEIKNLKKFKGVEYPDNYQGDIYLDGKKQGFWSQDSWGGPDRFDFNEEEIQKTAKEWNKKTNSGYDDIEVFMDELLHFTQIEKDVKKYFNKGYKTMVVMKSGVADSFVALPELTDEESAIKECKKEIEKFKDFAKKYHHYDAVRVMVINSMDAFRECENIPFKEFPIDKQKDTDEPER